MMSMGTADEETVRGLVRLPSTETVSRVAVSGLVEALSLFCATAAELVSSSAAASAAFTEDANGEIAFGA